MSNAKRAAALMLCVGLILVLFASSAFLVHEADHVCEGEHCEICIHMQQAVTVLRSLGLLALALLWAGAALLLRRVFHEVGARRPHALCTLVSWKVRLNN